MYAIVHAFRHIHIGLSRRAGGSTSDAPPLAVPQRTTNAFGSNGGALEQGGPPNRDGHQPQRIVPTPVDAPTRVQPQGVGVGVVRSVVLAAPVVQRRVVVRVGVVAEVQEGVRVECPVVVEAHNATDGRCVGGGVGYKVYVCVHATTVCTP